MTMTREVVDRYFAACSRGDTAAIVASFCDDAVVYDTNHRPVSGATDIGAFYTGVRRDRERASWHVDTFLGDEHGAAAEWTMLDRRTGGTVAVRGSEHYEFRDGRISQIRQYWTYDPDRPGSELRGYPYAEDPRFTRAGTDDVDGGRA